MYHYAISIGSEGEASCRDIPEFVTFGSKVDDIVEDAQGMLITILTIYQSQGSRIPLASAPMDDELNVPLSALTEAKISLWNTFLDSGYTLFEAAECTGVRPECLECMINLFAESELETIIEITWALDHKVNRVAVSA